jgi:hypothetical protein
MARTESVAGTGRLNWERPIHIVAAGWASSATLVVIFVVCLLVALLYPTAPLAHNWVELFSVAPINSGVVWVEGIIGSIAFAWLATIIGGLIYNRLAA